MPYVSRGALRHSVHLDKVVQQPDGEGGFEDALIPLDPADVAASIEPATTRTLERLTASATVEAVATHVVTIDYHPQVSMQTRVTFEGRVLQVRSIVNPDEANQQLQLICAEVLARGASEVGAIGFAGVPRRTPTVAV